MENTYTHYIKEFNTHTELDGNQNVIFEINYSVKGVNNQDNNISEEIHHTINLKAPSADYNFVDINDITEEQCIEWIKNDSSYDNLINVLDNRIELKIKPITSRIKPDFNKPKIINNE